MQSVSTRSVLSGLALVIILFSIPAFAETASRQLYSPPVAQDPEVTEALKSLDNAKEFLGTPSTDPLAEAQRQEALTNINDAIARVKALPATPPIPEKAE